MLPPIDTKGLTAADVDSLCQRTRDQMVNELIAVTELARSQRIALSGKEASETNGIATGTEQLKGVSRRAGQAVATT